MLTPQATRWLPIEVVGDAPPVTGGPPSPRDPDEPSVVIFTSGTTSRPKGVVHSLNTMLVATRNFIEPACLTAADNIFMISPLASVTGMLQAITVAPTLGAQVTIESRFDDVATFDFLVETGGTFFGGPDLLLDRVLDQASARGVTDVPITIVYLGGSMLDPRILARAEHDFGIVVLRAYGSSEAPVSTSGARDEPEAVRLADDGRPLRGVEVRIGSRVDPAECCIGGAHLFLGLRRSRRRRRRVRRRLVPHRRPRRAARRSAEDLRPHQGHRDPQRVEHPDRRGRRHGRARCRASRSARATASPTTRPASGWRWPSASQPGAALTFDAMVDGLVAAGAAKWKIPEELVVWDEPFPETASGKVQRNLLEERGAGRPAAPLAPAPAAERLTRLPADHELRRCPRSRRCARRSSPRSRSGSVMPVVMPRNSRDTRPPPTEYA